MFQIAQIDTFLQQHEAAHNLTQFTTDWIGETRDRVVAYRRAPNVSETDFCHALHYTAGNILTILASDQAADRAFYIELGALLNATAVLDGRIIHARRVNRAARNRKMSTLSSLALLLACITLGYLAITLSRILFTVMLEPPVQHDRQP